MLCIPSFHSIHFVLLILMMTAVESRNRPWTVITQTADRIPKEQET